jgi:hypothetical protein
MVIESATFSMFAPHLEGQRDHDFSSKVTNETFSDCGKTGSPIGFAITLFVCLFLPGWATCQFSQPWAIRLHFISEFGFPLLPKNIYVVNNDISILRVRLGVQAGTAPAAVWGKSSSQQHAVAGQSSQLGT